MGPQEKKAFAKGFQAGADSVEEGLPGWFGTFADMMTLLFAFFVLLAAISTMDPVKLQEMANSEGKSLGSEIEAEGAEDEGEIEPLKTLAEVKAAMEESIEQLEKESPKGDAPIDIQTSLKGLIVNIDGDYSFKSGDAKLKSELKKLLDEHIIPKIKVSPFNVEVAGHSDSDPMPRKWRKRFPSNWELSAARGAAAVRYMIEKGGIKAIRLIAAGYGDWTPKQLADYQSENPMYSPLKLTWNEKQTYTNEASGNTYELPTVLGWNATSEMKANNRRLQITFLATTADNLAAQQRSGDG